MLRVLFLSAVAMVLIGIPLISQSFISDTPPFEQSSVYFTVNQGQWDSRIQFRSQAQGYTIWIGPATMHYHLCGPSKEMAESEISDPNLINAGKKELRQSIVKCSFINASSNSIIELSGLRNHKSNFFFGDDPQKWRTDVPSYNCIKIKDLYSGIDVQYYGEGDRVEYDFILNPGADISNIEYKIENADSININNLGDLMIFKDYHIIQHHQPLAYQTDGNKKQEVSVQFAQTSDKIITLKLNDELDASLVLVIDPTIEYSTYLGGTDWDEGWGITVDYMHRAYVCGETFSADFPTLNPYQTDMPNWDAYVTKFNYAGDNIIYSTYIGGIGADNATSIAVDINGQAYITGWTNSLNFPLMNEYQAHQGDMDAFLTKLNSNGNGLIYSTYFGGSDVDGGWDITIDIANQAHLVGETESPDFPLVNELYGDSAGVDGFVAIFDSSGTFPRFSTYLGGNDIDLALAICLDRYYNIYVVGRTGSIGFPAISPIHPYRGAHDGFITKINRNGTSTIFSTFLGGSDSDYVRDIWVSYTDSIFVTGVTWSNDFPIVNEYQTNQPGVDAFVSKVDYSGSFLSYSTYLGGSGWDASRSIVADQYDQAYVLGHTSSLDFPIRLEHQSFGGIWDIFLSQLNMCGNGLVYSSYFGGSDTSIAKNMAIDDSNHIYFIGSSWSNDFPVHNNFQNHQGDGDAVVVKMSGFFLCGDANGDGVVDISDAIYVLNWAFGIGPPPNPIEKADVNCDDSVDISDVVYIINYAFGGGLCPCAYCP